MKKYIIIIAILCCASGARIYACDICGCGVGSNYIGILPEFRRYVWGLRYRYNSLLTHIGAGGAHTYLTAREKYHTAELWGGWNITERWRIMFALPYSMNERQNIEMGYAEKTGLGDASLFGYYQAIRSREIVFGNKMLAQSLWAGGGVKFPTGAYNPEDERAASNSANLFQLGTGSYDFTIGFMYDIRLQDAGLNLSSNYKINTANSDAYRYGNKFSFNAQAYYKFKLGNKCSLSPNVGVQYEYTDKDMREEKWKVAISGGDMLLGGIGVEFAFGKFSIGANFQMPVEQRIANGVIQMENKAMAHFSFML